MAGGAETLTRFRLSSGIGTLACPEFDAPLLGVMPLGMRCLWGWGTSGDGVLLWYGNCDRTRLSSSAHKFATIKFRLTE
jgi:hypothetical protein